MASESGAVTGPRTGDPAPPRPPQGTMPDPGELPRPWLAAYPPGVPPRYDYPAVPLTRFLDDAARDFPDVAVTALAGTSLTYTQMLDLVDRFAAALAELGVATGDRVGVCLPNLPAAPVAVFAALRLGAVVVPLPADLGDEDLRWRMRDAACGVLVTTTTAVPQIGRVRAHLPALRHVVVTGHEDWLSWRHRVLLPVTGRRRGLYRRVRPDDEVVSFRELLDGHDPVARQAPVSGEDLAVIQYARRAGGPVGVRLTHANLVANAFQARLWVPDTQAGNERVLAALPFTDPYGFSVGLLASVLSVATLLLVPRFDAGRALAVAAKRRPTLFPAVPSMLAAMVDHPEASAANLSSLRACLSGGAPLAAEVADRFERLSGARVRQGYGRTEAGPLTHANPVYGRAIPGKIGLPVTDTVAAVVDPDDPGTVLEPGRSGVLAVHGPQVMPGYWNRPDLDGRVLRDGWLVTGDRVVVDEDGYFALVPPADHHGGRK